MYSQKYGFPISAAILVSETRTRQKITKKKSKKINIDRSV